MPEADIAPTLFDHLIGAREECWWHGEPECLGSLEVDDQLELNWLLDRKIGWLGTSEYLVDVDGGASIHVDAPPHKT